MSDKTEQKQPVAPRKNEGSTNSSSNQNDRSKKMNESVVPMELNVDAVPEERRGKIKNLFLKAAKKVGFVKTTEFNEQYLAAVKEADNYKKVITDICMSTMKLCQPNSKFINKDFTRMEFEAPPGEDPFEKLAATLPTLDEHFPNKEFLAANIEIARNLAAARRLYQQKIRRELHFMRTYLNVDCTQIDDERRHLITCRQDMDFACHEYTNNATEAKRLTYERAQQRFNIQMDKVFELLNQIPQKKVEHSNELGKLLVEMKTYHETCYAECQKLRRFHPHFGTPTPYETL